MVGEDFQKVFDHFRNSLTVLLGRMVSNIQGGLLALLFSLTVMVFLQIFARRQNERTFEKLSRTSTLCAAFLLSGWLLLSQCKHHFPCTKLLVAILCCLGWLAALLGVLVPVWGRVKINTD